MIVTVGARRRLCPADGGDGQQLADWTANGRRALGVGRNGGGAERPKGVERGAKSATAERRDGWGLEYQENP